MKTAVDTLAVARRNIGVVEGKNNSNPYAAVAGDANNQAWCASFVRACLVKAGVLKKGAPAAYCPTFKASLPAVSRANVKPGDVMFIYFPSEGRVAHTGLVEAVFKDHVVTIEGNTDAAGGRTGGKVMRKQRSYKNLSFVRPPYAKPAAPKAPAKAKGDPVVAEGARGQTVLNIQNALKKHGYKTALDGDFGPGTKKVIIAFQKAKKITADGVVGQTTWNALRQPKGA